MTRLRAVVRRTAPEPLLRVARRVRGRTPRPRAPRRQYRYVFIVTYGRSGSTLTQGLLNALPRTLVRGENDFYLLHLFRAWSDIRAFRQVHLKHNPRAGHSAFYGLHEIKPASLVRTTHDLLTGHMLGSVPPREVDVLGFKEVLWHRVEESDVPDFFDFLERAFPGCRYVLNQRDHSKVVDSGFWQAKDRDEVMAAIRRVEDIQAFLRETRPDRTLDVHYEQVTSDDPATSDGQLRAIAEFAIGSCDEPTMEAMRTTLSTGHGPYPFGKSRGRRERRRAQ